MDLQTAMTPTQLLLIWILTGLLLAWMIIFALLALRPEYRKKADFEDIVSSTDSLPQLHIIVNQQQVEIQDIHFEQSVGEIKETSPASR